MAEVGSVAVQEQGEIAQPKKRGRPRWVAPPRVDKDFDLLAAMRHCLNNPGGCDESAGERACREWMKKSPGGFMEEFNRLSALAAPKVAKDAPAEAPAETDEADEVVEEAICELLKRLAPPGSSPR